MASIQRSFSQYSRSRSPRARSPNPKCQQKPLKTGFLKKQGGNFKTWTNRWFVIRGDQMYYYAKEDEVKELGVIPLPGNKVISHPHNIDEPGKYLFEVIAGRGQARVTAAHETYLIWASSKDEREAWISAIHRVIHAPSGGGVFGQSLADTMMYERKRRTRRMIPKVVENCVRYLESNGMNVEGIFRLPGLNKTIKKLKVEYDTAIGIDLTRDEIDVNSVASLLKLYFRELPEPVIPFQYYEMFLTMGLKIEHGDPRAMGTIHTLLDQLPVDNYNLLKYLCEFLNDVSKHSVENKMPAMNLALVFGPNILKADIDDPSLLMSTTDLTTKTVFIFVEKFAEVFIREIEEGSWQGSSDNLLNLKKNYNSRTLNRPISPLALNKGNGSDTERARNPLIGSLPLSDPPVGDLVDFDDELPGPYSVGLLSPETGETKSLSDLSCDSGDSASLPSKISLLQGRVSYRSGSQSRRSRRSNQIVKCQTYEQDPSSSESSPEILDSSVIRDGIAQNMSDSSRSGSDRPERPVPARRNNAPSNKKNRENDKGLDSEFRDADKLVIGAVGEGDEAFVKPIAPRRTSRKKHSRNPSEASEASVESISSPPETLQSGDVDFTPDVAAVNSKGAVGVDANSSDVAKLMETITSLQITMKEQEMHHHREMTELKQKHESKLKSMEDMFKGKINQLAKLLTDERKLLTDERTATAQTVDRIVGLQAELQQYQMKYGSLENSEEWKPLI